MLSQHFLQHVPALVIDCTSCRVWAPDSTASLILRFVTFMQLHTGLSKFIMRTSFDWALVCGELGWVMHGSGEIRK